MGGMPLPPPPTQCYPLYSFYSLYSPPHSTIRQRINCRSASFFGSCFATAVPHLSGVTTHDSVLQAIAAVFFRRSRLFFREAAFFSGGEGCEWGAKQPTVGESGDKAENELSGLTPLVVPRKGFSPHIPASRLFVLFHTSKPTILPSPRIAFKFFLRNIWEIGGKIRIFAPHLRLWRNW